MYRKIILLVSALVLFGALQASAHTPLCSCSDNGDGTVTCIGSFSNGASAAGVNIFILDAAQTVIDAGKMSDISEYTFKKPEGEYSVKFAAGKRHELMISGSEIH